MKVKEGFMLREVADNYVVVPVGSAATKFNGVITLNSTGAFLWKKLTKEITISELVSSLVQEYEVDATIARTDVEKFIEKLAGANLIE